MEDELFILDLKEESPLQVGCDAPCITFEQLCTLLRIVFEPDVKQPKCCECVRVNNIRFYPNDLADELELKKKYSYIEWLE